MARLHLQVILGASLIALIALISADSPLTPREWSDTFRCTNNNTDCSSRLTCRRQERDVCSRDPAGWMWKYVDELEPEFQVIIKEQSADERLANIIYTVVTTRAVDGEIQRVEANEPELHKELEARLIGGQVNETRCGHQLTQMVQQMQQFAESLQSQRRARTKQPMSEQHIRLARVLDSYGRYTSGMMSGKQYLIGSYDQCVNSQLLLSSSSGEPTTGARQEHLVQMRFCWAAVDLEQSLSIELATRRRFDFEQGRTALQVAVCLPDSCHSRSLDQHREAIQRLLDSQFMLPQSIYLNKQVNITSLSCVADSQSPMLLRFPTSGRLLAGLLAVWLSLVAFASFHTRRGTENKNWMTCISFFHNWSDFLELNNHLERNSSSTDIDVLNPIKCLACLWATMVHAILALHFMSNSLLRDHKLIDTDRAMTLIITSPLVVETYFVLSGLLTTFLALRRLERGNRLQTREQFYDLEDSAKLEIREQLKLDTENRKWTRWAPLECCKSCLAIIAARYLRLLPLFYLAFWAKKSVTTFAHLGPFWNHGLNRDSGGQCQHDSWWSPLLLSSVYEPILSKCLPQSYTITSELIFVLLAAPLIVLIDKFPRIIVTLATMVGLASIWAGVAAILAIDKPIWWDLSNFRSWGFFQLFSRSMSHIYTSPEYRLYSIVFGILAGWLVYRYEKCSPKEQSGYMKHPAIRLLTWFSFGSTLFTFLGGAYRNELRLLLEPLDRNLFAFNFVLTRVFWAASSAVLCVRLLTDWNHRPLLGWWTKSKFWRILVKLNYAILLIHLDLLFLDWQFNTSETILTWYKLISLFICVYAYSIGLAIAVHVLVESPLNKLIKRYVI